MPTTTIVRAALVLFMLSAPAICEGQSSVRALDLKILSADEHPTDMPQAMAGASGATPPPALERVILTDDVPPAQRANDEDYDFAAGAEWCTTKFYKCFIRAPLTAGSVTSWKPIPIGRTLPLDVAAADGVQAQGWWGTQLATKNPAVVAANKAADVWRNSDGQTRTFGWTSDGDIDAAAIDTFCEGATSCEVSRIYDQSFDIAKGLPNRHDATQTPGYLVAAAKLANDARCADGDHTFHIVGGTGLEATISATVKGGTFVGPLVVQTTGSYQKAPPDVVQTTGGDCTTQPVMNIAVTQRALLWTKNLVNGHRSFTAENQYTGGDPTYPNGRIVASEWMNWPADLSVNYSSVSLLFAGQLQNAFYNQAVLATLGQPRKSWMFSSSNSPKNPGCNSSNMLTPAYACVSNKVDPVPSLTSPAVWSFLTGPNSTQVSVGNKTGLIPLRSPNGLVSGGSIGAGIDGGARYGLFDMLEMGIFGTTLSKPGLEKITASLNLKTNMSPQSIPVVVVVGDSIGYGTTSIAGNNWAKLLSSSSLLPAKPATINMSYPGGQFYLGPYDFTTNFADNWKSIYEPKRPIFAIVALGTNDLGTGASAEKTYALAQAYSKKLIALGSNVHPIFCTVLPRLDATPPLNAKISEYNALLRAPIALRPVAEGGLGATAIIDWESDPIWSKTDHLSDLLVKNGAHPNDTGYSHMAVTAAAVLNALLNKEAELRK